MGTFTVKIKFIDGEELYLENISSYGITDISHKYYIAKNGYQTFLNPDEVKYIGRKFDLNNEKR